jgi:hypothetical protein
VTLTTGNVVFALSLLTRPVLDTNPEGRSGI